RQIPTRHSGSSILCGRTAGAGNLGAELSPRNAHFHSAYSLPPRLLPAAFLRITTHYLCHIRVPMPAALWVILIPGDPSTRRGPPPVEITQRQDRCPGDGFDSRTLGVCLFHLLV